MNNLTEENRVTNINLKCNKKQNWNKASTVGCEVIVPHMQTNKHAFASIIHKNTFGANNWTKFRELNQENKKVKSNKGPLPKTKLSNTNVSVTSSNIASMHNNKTFRTSTTAKKVPSITQKATDKGNLSTDIEVPSGSSLDGMSQKVVFGKVKNEVKEIVLTKQIAMDCEMVGVEIGVKKSMLARVSLLNAHGDCIYDKYVQPTEPVLDYRTQVSGIRPKDLENATDFKIVQKEVADIINGRILIGHALKNDLQVLFLSHPKLAIRDTSKFKKFREGRSPALKKLAKKYLGVTIQEGEHSSVQDALAAMQLYKMFKKEWEGSLYSKKHKPVSKFEKKTNISKPS